MLEIPTAPSNRIAIVGLAGRFPAARSAGELWQLLSAGKEATRWLSNEELLRAGESAETLADPNYVKAAMILSDMEMFDAGFFGFTPREAAVLDPQHRHFLETCWEALEDAGYVPSRFPGSIGVFGGCGMQAYMAHNLLPNRALVEQMGLFLLRHTGNDKDFLTTRVSYLLDLKGPSVGVQTACSTSLVAVHVACQSLLSHECDMALAGGVSIEVPHARGYRFAEGEILSSTGQCRAFDDGADGTLFGSGAGVVVLRRLEGALEDGDHIYAVIRGTAVNNDGAGKAGYLAPSVDGQARVAAEALAVAEVDPETVDYIEAHGTGTRVGDPIELTALEQAYRGAPIESIGIGSIKTNIGHLDTAAGVASLIKVALALRHERIPPSLNFSRPNANFAFETSPFRVAAEARPWVRSAKPRRASVNSLGVGGTNAHVLVEEGPQRQPTDETKGPQLILLSGKTHGSLDALRRKWIDFLQSSPRDFNVADAAFTTQEGRQHFAHRLAVAGETADDIVRVLSGSSPARRLNGVAADIAPRVVFMFPGGGAQFPGAGRTLYLRQPTFRKAADDCFAAMPPFVPDDLRSLMFERDDPAAAAALEHPLRSVVAVFVVEYALGELWRSWGVTPAAMIGHSAGEYAVAALSSVMTLGDALATVALRGRIFAALPSGGMLTVKAEEARVRALAGNELDVAAVNATDLVVVSGPGEAIKAFNVRLGLLGVECSRVRINVAAHSRLLDGALAEFRAHIAGTKLNNPDIPVISNLSGEFAKNGELTDPDYWVKQLRHTVRFGDGLRAALNVPGTILLEVGPGQSLAGLAALANGTHEALAVISSSRSAGEPVDDEEFALSAAGRLWAHGVPIDFQGLRGKRRSRRIPLPTYAFDKQRHWIDPPLPWDDRDSADARTWTSENSTRRIQRKDSIEDWALVPSWTQRPLAPAISDANASWLVFADGSPLSKAVLGAICARGEQPVVAEPGGDFAQRGSLRFTIRPSSPEDYSRLLEELPQRPSRILHLWSISAPAPNVEASEVAQPLGFDSLLLLGQAMQLGNGSGERRLCIVTSGALAPNGEKPSHPDRAALVGPCRVLPREIPGLFARLVDLDAAADPAIAAAALLTETEAEADDAVVAYRGGTRWVLTETPVEAHTPVQRLRERGIYLITGGLGGLGLELAEHLARTTRARLAFTSREAFPPRDKWVAIAESSDRSGAADQVRRLLRLEELGAETLVVKADVADFRQARRAVDAVRARFGSINGVFHAAGMVDDGLVGTKTLASAHNVLAPKVAGVRALDALLPPGSLDIFAVFSSTSAIVGPPGQIDYAAANAVLDAVASARPDGLSMTFGIWADVGIAARLGGAPRQTEAGSAAHPLLGTRSTHGETVRFTTTYDPSTLWVLAEHQVAGCPVLPGTAYVEIATASAAGLGLGADLTICSANFVAPLALAKRTRREVRTSLTPGVQGGYRCEVESRRNASEPWALHFEAIVAPGQRLRGKASTPELALQPIEQGKLSLAERGVAYGPRWQCLESVARFADMASGEVSLDSRFAGDLETYRVHPALLDVAATIGLFLVETGRPQGGLYVPMSVDVIALHAPLPKRCSVWTRLVTAKAGEFATFDVEIADERQRLVMSLEGFTLRRVAVSAISEAARAPAGTDTSPLDRMLAAGIRAADAPEVFARALAARGPQIVMSSIPVDLVRAAYAPVAPSAVAARQPLPATSGTEYANQTEARIARICSDILGIETLPPEANFMSYGGGSLAGVRVFGKIRKEFGVNLSLSALFQAPTVRQLAALVRESAQDKAASAPWSPLVRMAPGTTARRPVFCVHGAGGNVLVFKPLVDRLSGDVPVYGIQARGVDGRAPFHETIEEMAATYVAAIREVDPSGPYRLTGYSGGGLIAYEMAQQIVRAGGEVELLAMFDTLAPAESCVPLTQWDKIRVLKYRAPLFVLSWPLRNAMFRWKNFRVRLMDKRIIADTRSHLEIVGEKAVEAFMRAQARYQASTFDGDIVLFRASMAELIYLRADRTLGWRSLVAGNVEIHEIDANHQTVFQSPSIEVLASVLNAKLEALDAADVRSGHDLKLELA